jgi:hypothetical protein
VVAGQSDRLDNSQDCLRYCATLDLSLLSIESLGSRLQSSRAKGFIRKVEVTCITISQFSWKTVQEV